MNRSAFRLCLAALMSCVLLGAPAPGNNPAQKQFRPGEITFLSFSPDGKRLLANYYIHPRNRSQTDWDAYGVIWDLETGKRLHLPQAAGPMAFSADGKTLAVGWYERKGRIFGWPYLKLALVK